MALVSAGGRRRKVILLLVVLFAATHCEEESSDHTVEVEEKEEEEEGNVDVTKMTLNEDEINLISRPDHSKGLLQGDILLTPEQEKMMRGDVVNKRAVVVDTSYLWPGAVVPYSFTSSLPSSYRSVIIEAMNEISDKSCVEFVPRSRETHYIRFISGNGCYSYIGRLGRGSQDISIGRGCQSEGIVMHEIIHALGRWHEQSRPDRDRYIEIHHENILRDYEDQFRLVSTSDATTNNIAYDYYSIMHYGAYAFSKNYARSATITPRDAKIDLNDLGQRRLLSTKDIEHIQQLYCGGGGESTAESEWSSWSSWSQCSSSCGSGLQSRSRTCLPANSGASCPGHNRETRFCDPDSPNCSGQWFPWTSWSSCTPSCGSTRTRTRTRSCRGLGQCSGDSSQTVSCASRVCPENMAEWSSWTSCSQTCRRSYQLRVRTNCGNSCPRPRYEFRLCSMPSYCFRQWRSDQQVDSQLSNNSDVMGMNATATTNGCPRNHQPMLSFLSLLCLYYLIIAVVRVL